MRMHYYDGPGKPSIIKDVDWFYALGIPPRFISMDQEEHDYLFALQLMHGSQVELVSFQEYHDFGWANQKQNPLDRYMQGVCCSHPALLELMIKPHGDEIAKKQMKIRRDREQAQQLHINQSIYPSRMFI